MARTFFGRDGVADDVGDDVVGFADDSAAAGGAVDFGGPAMFADTDDEGFVSDARTSRSCRRPE